MLGDFTYSNPTRLHFGPNAMEALAREAGGLGQTVLLVYGGGSIKRNGIYDQVTQTLRACGKTLVEDPGVMPNPTVEKLRQGCRLVRDHQVNGILAVGGGSVCDYAKAVSVSAHCPEDPWGKFFIRKEPVTNAILPVGCVLTMVGTGSEMNGGAVLSNPATKQKIGRFFEAEAFPKFAILNPLFTYTVPRDQMAAGCYDIMSHLLEQYLSGDDDNTSDYLIEGLLRSLLRSSRAALRDPRDYEARSNLMWIATWALNGLVSKGKTTDWMVHMLGQAVGAHTDATHGMTLSAVTLPYYRFLLPYAVPKFRRLAVNVWGISLAGRSDEAVAREGLARLDAYLNELGLARDLRTLGVTEAMLGSIAAETYRRDGGYHPPDHQEILAILRESLDG